jgi:eukaryotic-like serine/threonine-protein kinase
LLGMIQDLARVYQAGDKCDRAEPLLEELVAAGRKAFGADNPMTAGLLAQLALNHLKRRQYTAAEPVLRDCLRIREQKQPDLWMTFNTRSLLGEALLGQKQYADAEPLLVKGYEGMKAREKAIPPQANTRIPEALERLIELYTVTHKPDEARKWRAERAKYPEARKAAAAEKK